MKSLLISGDPVYYHSPEGDTIPTRIVKTSPISNRVKLARVRLDDQYCSDRQRWVPISRIELQREAN